MAGHVPHSQHSLRNYSVVTAAYWGFTLTDGAIRMLVVLFFYQLGYSPFEIAMLFLFYEFFGVVTNLLGGWLASRTGTNNTLFLGMGLQVFALFMLAVPVDWLTVPYVMFAQALSGIAKDLNKMSAKSSVKLMLPEGEHGQLFKWVALLTGSKNALKGAGFFLGGYLLHEFGFQSALIILASGLLILLMIVSGILPRKMGKVATKVKFKHLFSRKPAINILSTARLFLFGARDVWFVVGLPVYLSSVLGWSHTEVGGFLALWIIGYGVIQSSAPRLIRHRHRKRGPGGKTAVFWVLVLTLISMLIPVMLMQDIDSATVITVGLIFFGVVFAINSAIHSYLILAFSKHEVVTTDVGFYYMANAVGRLLGTVLSGGLYQIGGIESCLYGAVIFLIICSLVSMRLPSP